MKDYKKVLKKLEDIRKKKQKEYLIFLSPSIFRKDNVFFNHFLNQPFYKEKVIKKPMIIFNEKGEQVGKLVPFKYKNKLRKKYHREFEKREGGK